MRRVWMVLAALFGFIAVTGFGAAPVEAKRIKLSTVAGAYAAKKVLTAKKKDTDGQDSRAQLAGDDDGKPAEPSKAVQEARAAAMDAAKAKLAAEKAAAAVKRTEGAVELASAKMPANSGVVCLAGCLHPR